MFGEDFHVKTDAFEGPLELLLDLIEKRKLHINDISLSAVTDDFIGFIKNKENFPLGLSSHFILVASTLLLIKSKSLLPSIELTAEEEASMEDLGARLKEYQRIKHLSGYVRELFGKKIIFPKLSGKQEVIVFAPDVTINTTDICTIAESLIQNLPQKEFRPEVKIQKIITLEDMITRLTERISGALRMSFKDFSGHGKKTISQEEKTNIIVGFLAVLELAKQGTIAVSQGGLFDDIHMETDDVATPMYK